MTESDDDWVKQDRDFARFGIDQSRWVSIERTATWADVLRRSGWNDSIILQGRKYPYHGMQETIDGDLCVLQLRCKRRHYPKIDKNPPESYAENMKRIEEINARFMREAELRAYERSTQDMEFELQRARDQLTYIENQRRATDARLEQLKRDLAQKHRDATTPPPAPAPKPEPAKPKNPPRANRPSQAKPEHPIPPKDYGDFPQQLERHRKRIADVNKRRRKKKETYARLISEPEPETTETPPAEVVEEPVFIKAIMICTKCRSAGCVKDERYCARCKKIVLAQIKARNDVYIPKRQYRTRDQMENIHETKCGIDY